MEKCYLIVDKIDKSKISDSISLSYEDRFIRKEKNLYQITVLNF